MPKVLKKKKQGKISLQEKGDSICRNDKELPLFSFVHLTNNSDYNFKYFKRDMLREELSCRKEAENLLKLLSSTSWLEMTKRDKEQKGGYETITFEQLNFSPVNLKLTKDTKILSFRFGNGDNFRMLGWRKDGCQGLYVIGYDFEFKAYNHG